MYMHEDLADDDDVLEYYENKDKKEALEQIDNILKKFPTLVPEILNKIAQFQYNFKTACEKQQNQKADKAILDLTCALANPKYFFKLNEDRQKNLMHRVIDYHFPDGIEKGAYSQGEREFFIKFSKNKKS